MEFAEYTIGNISTSLKTGKTPKTSNPEYFDGNILWVTPSDFLGKKYITTTERKITDVALEKNGASLYKPGTVLISTIGQIGKVAIVDKPISANQQITGIRLKGNIILPELFYYWVLLNKKILENKANKAIISQLSNKLLKRISLRFPKEIKDQQNFISYLNNIQEVIDLRIETIEIVEKLKRTAFLDFFLENVDSNKWDYTTLQESGAIKSTTYGLATRANEDGKGYIMLRMNNISYEGNITLVDLKNVEITEEVFKRFELKDRDILFNRTNSPDLVGKTTVWSNGPGYTFAGYLIRIELKEDILNPYFFCSYLNSDFGKKVLKNKARLSGNLANISATTLLKQKILFPPKDLQEKYETFYIQLEALKEKLNLSLKYLETIFKSTLQNAFTENVKLDENLFFEDLIASLSLDELREKKRLNTLIDWVDKKQNRFTSFEKYDEAYKVILALLEDGSLDQDMANMEIILKVKNEAIKP